MRFFAAAALFAGAAMAAPGMGEIEERQYDATVTETDVSTIYSCGPEVTSCPYSTPTVTVAPVYTTSIVYATIEHTITSCPPEVTDCPAESVVISTETVEDYTTICPVEATETPITTTSVYVAPVELSYITYTTCIPSTWVSTVTVTPTPTYTVSAAPTYSANSSYISLPTTPPQFEGSGSSIKASLMAAGIIALGAMFFA